ncbi:MAG TPA: polysaccharide biosynthesis tyrosine autokinase [Vicinamibacterales bacterium]|jgi:succinoglycan biosynthesis transport protein ExoP|nr:polysaccharide biosynthesis tyrosine autokinase [Vicinamibacterales bacterium]
MKTPNRPQNPALAAAHVGPEERQLMDYVRILYKRRWIAAPVFLLVFVIGAVNALRQIPIYQSRVQMLIETDSPKVAKLDQMFQTQEGWYNDDFYQTQYRILQSRTLAKRTIDAMKLWDAPRLGNGPEPKAAISVTGMAWTAVDAAIALAKKPFADDQPARPEAAPTAEAPADKTGETAAESGRIDEFLGGVTIVPVRNSRLVEIRYTSSDPQFAAAAANALAKAYIDQNMEFRFNASKDAADWLGSRLGEQRKALESSEAALQAYKEKNGAVSVAENASSNIVVQRLTDLNAALTKAKTERITKEAQYNQLKSAEGSGALDTLPSVLANEYIQKLKTELADAQRNAATLAQRYGERNPEMIKATGAVQAADAKLHAEIAKVAESVKNEYETALSQERTLQGALDSQKHEALSLQSKGIEFGVLQREVESNKQIYESLLQRTKETGISGELRATNVRVVDPAEVPRAPISPNVQRDLMMSFGGSLALAIGLAFFFERIDNRIRTPQEMKAHLGVPFLGMVPAVADKNGSENPLLNNGVSPNFVEAFKTVRTNVLFSSSEDGLKTLVITSAGPGEGKSIVAANLALALAQAGQRVLLVDGDMRRPRVHEIYDCAQEPGLSNVLTGHAKLSEALRKSAVPGLWLLAAGQIPPNPAELLGSRRYLDLIASLDEHFDWAIIDTPPVLAVADSSIAANESSGVVFVVGSDKTSRQAARAAVEQLLAANAHIVGSVLNKVDLIKHPYYYAAYYRKEYARYYVSSST